MLMVHVAPAPRAAPQVPPDREKGAVTVTPLMVAPTAPVLCSVRAWAALVVPCNTLVKVSEVGVTLSPGGSWCSTAPTSKLLTLSRLGRGFPKKSVDGCDWLAGTLSMTGEPSTGT